MAEAGVFETFGFLFTAKDLASAVIEKTDAGIAAAALGVDTSLKAIAKGIEVTGGLAAKLLMKTIGQPFKSVFGDAAQLSMKVATKAFSSAITAIKRPLEDIAAGTINKLMAGAAKVFAFPDKVKKVYGDLAFTVENAWDATKEAVDKAKQGVVNFIAKGVDLGKTMKFLLFNKQYTFEGMFKETWKAGSKAVTTIKDTIGVAKDKLATFWTKLRADGGVTAVTLKKGIVNAWHDFTDLVLKKSGAVKEKLGGIFGMLKGGAGAGLGKLGGALKGLGGGLVSAFAGPIGYVVELLQPLIDMFKRSFEPALETISVLVENAFAPFAGLLDTIAQSLQPIITKMLTPLVGIMEMLAAQAGVFLQKLLPVEGAVDPLASIFEQIAPLAMEIADAVGQFASELSGTLFDTIKETGPILVKSVLDITKALLPLLPHVLKLGAALAKHVFSPLLIKAVQGIGLIVEHVIVPAVKWLVDNLGPWLDETTAAVADFYGNFGKYMTDFYVLFIQPVIDFFVDDIPNFFTVTIPDAFDSAVQWIKDGLVSLTTSAKELFTGLLSGLGFDTLAQKVGGVFDAVIKAIQSPIETIKGLINEYIVGSLNSILGWSVPVVGKKLADILGIKEIPKLAEGGIAGLGGRGTAAVVGEAGPEAILPLRAETFREVVAPVFGDMPALKEIAGILTDIHKALTGTLKVDAGDTSGGGRGGQQALAGRSSEAADFGAAVGVVGLGR